MCRIRSSISLAVTLALASAAVTATEPAVAEPRMVGDVDGGKLYVEDATLVGDDLAFLGTRGRERLSLRWIDADKDRERKLATVKSGEMPRELATAAEGVVFTGFRGRQGTEPWRTDGTRAGTRLIREIHKGQQSENCVAATPCGTFPAGSDPESFLTIGETTLFVANHPKYGPELWRTDGTRAGTRLVKDIAPGPASGLASAGDSLVEFKDQLFFVADDGRRGRELWRTDGTRAGTRLVRDIGPGWSAAWWMRPVVVGEQLYFAAEREAEGLELWRTDGTRAGTRLVHDIRPGPKSAKPMDLTAVGEQLYFTARDREHGRELWRTDGSAEGTTLVADLSPGRASSTLGDLVAFGDQLYLTAWGDHGDPPITSGLWRTDADSTGLEPVRLGSDDAPVARRYWSEYPSLATHGGRLIFTARDAHHGNELWATDGTNEGTSLLADLLPGAAGSDPAWLMTADSVLYVVATDRDRGRQLWALPLEAPVGDSAGT